MKLKPLPVAGATREVRRFAWLPVTLDSAQRIWLEFYFTFESREYYYTEDCKYLDWTIRGVYQ